MSEAAAANSPPSSASNSGGTEGVITCPYCGDNVPALMAIETGLKLRLARDAQMGQIPDAVCEGCMKVFGKMMSKGAALRNEQQAKEQNRLMLWKNRIQLVKQAKIYLSQKNFADAAVAYEKYLKILEIVFEIEAGDLTPETFKNQVRNQEVTLVATVYWDLMRIYDTHPSYRERQYKTAQKLAEFVRFTPVFSHIVRKAESQTRTAKNPDAFVKFLKLSNAHRPRCFIATSAFDSYDHPVIIQLCRFRDHVLRKSPLGRWTIVLYYRQSPGIAESLDRNPFLKPFVRAALTRIANSRFIRNRLND